MICKDFVENSFYLTYLQEKVIIINMNVNDMFEINNKIAIRKLEKTYLVVTLDNVLHHIEDPVGVFIMDFIRDYAKPASADAVWLAVRDAFDVNKDPKGYKSSVFLFLQELAKKGIIINV